MSFVKFIKTVGQPDGPVEIVALNHLFINKQQLAMEGHENVGSRYAKAGVQLLFIPQDVCPGAMLFEMINRGSCSTLLQYLRPPGANQN